MTTKKNYLGVIGKVSKIALAIHLAMSVNPAIAQDSAVEKEKEVEVINITGSRIPRTEVAATSPVTSIGEEQIQLDRAVTVDDIIFKLPQAPSSGANSGSSSVIDLRSLGQNRTLVLINGTRAVPFGFRNSVDVNAIPAGLIKQVDVLTGGAAAVYGADAVAGVVNFIMDDNFEGVEISTGYELPSDGGETFNVDAIFGGDIFDGNGHLTGFVGYSDRKELLAGARDFAMLNSTSVINNGGFYTDVASGNSFGISDDGSITDERNTQDITASSYLVPPMSRLTSGMFWDVELSESAVLYGRTSYSQVEVISAGSTSQTPISVNEEVVLTSDNAYIPAAVLGNFTFDENGEAVVQVERNLGLGLQKTKNLRDTTQFQFGIKGDITDYLFYDVYAQHGRTSETAKVSNTGYKTDASGNGTFAAIANSVDLFDPTLALTELEATLLYHDRERTQNVAAFTLSGESTPFFELPAGPVSFAVGYEYKRESAIQSAGDAFKQGTTFSASSSAEINASFYSKETYGELLIPIVEDLFLIQQLDFEGAYRISSYSNTEAEDTYKLGLNWTLNDDLRVRWTNQTAFRAPNIGEFAGPSAGLPLSLFDPYNDAFISRLAGRFEGDPCLLGTGDAEQCARYGAPAVGTEWDSSSAQYTYGGNPNIKPEQSESTTLGVVYTPSYIDGFDMTVDYYNIEITDAIYVIQPAAALQNCYIDNPVAGNPLCDAVLRDADTGLISTALVNDFNVSTFLQTGFDISASYSFAAPETLGGAFNINYAGNYITKSEKQLDVTQDPIDCTGTYGSACSGDSTSMLQADYKQRASMGWTSSSDNITAQLSWRRIGEVEYASDRTISIDAQDYIDLSAAWQATDSLSVNLGIDNVFDKQAPVPEAGASRFNTVVGYDVVGRSVGITLRYKPMF